MNHRPFLIIALLISIVTSSACIYRVDIQQGNRIDAKTMEKLDLGMTRRQVEFLLGKPAIEDPYHADQWHYIYYFKSGSSGAMDKRVMVLFFTDDKLSSYEGSLEGGWF